MARDANQVSIPFSMGSDEQVSAIFDSCAFLKDLSTGAKWPEASGEK